MLFLNFKRTSRRMKRIISILLIVLGAMALFLLIQTGAGELPSRDLVLNESSMLQSVNEDLREQIHRQYERIEENTVHSQHPRIIEARKLAKKADVLTDTLNRMMQEAVSFAYSEDSVKSKLTDVRNTLTQLVPAGHSEESLVKSMVASINDSIQTGMQGDRATLSLLLLQNDILYVCSHYMIELSSLADVTTVKFDAGLYEKQKPQWVKGLIAFNAPAQMNLGQKARVQVRISKRFEKTILETMRKEGSLTSDTLSVGDIMMVKLLGDAFDITAFDEEEQGVTDDGYTQWEFDVTPRSSGDHELFIKAGIVYYVPNLGPTKKYFPVYEKTISVHVSVWQQVAGFAHERWEFIVSSILIPVGVWLITRIRQRKISQ